jgi:uncharacterized membrane protein
MIKKYKSTLLLGSIVTLLPILAGLLLWDKLPDTVPSHWGPTGEVDGWSTKTQAVFLMPCVLLALHWVCVLVTTMDPKNKNQSKKPMLLVLWICPVLSLLLNIMTLGTALGWAFDVIPLMMLFTGALFMAIGNYLPKCTHSYTIGIKIPWTLNSEENWNRTHRLAGRIWLVGGLAIMLTGFVGGVWLFLPIVLTMVLAPFIYSYILHQKGV